MSYPLEGLLLHREFMRLPFRAYWDLLSRHIRPQKGRFALLVVLLLVSIGLRVFNQQILRQFIDLASAGAPLQTLMLAALTFIGIGLSPHTPAVGIILTESMRNLSTGYWWLAVMPGLALLLTVKMFDVLGENVRTLIDPKTSQG